MSATFSTNHLPCLDGKALCCEDKQLFHLVYPCPGPGDNDLTEV